MAAGFVLRQLEATQLNSSLPSPSLAATVRQQLQKDLLKYLESESVYNVILY